VDLSGYSIEELVNLEKEIKFEIKVRKKKYTLRAKKVKDSHYLYVFFRVNEKLTSKYIGKVGVETTYEKILKMEKEKTGILDQYKKILSSLSII
jgi:cell division protein FtsI/penicillin-binding protein 2